MSKAQVSGIDIEDIRLGWDDVAEIAGDLFDDLGNGSGGLRWAKSAWQVLSEAGLNRYFLEVQRTVCIIRFIALFALYSEFCVRAFDEGNAGNWEYIAALVTKPPYVLTIGKPRRTLSCGFLIPVPGADPLGAPRAHARGR